MSKMSELARVTEKVEIAYINSQCEKEPEYVSSCCTEYPYGNINEFEGEYYGLCGKCKEHTDFIDNNEEQKMKEKTRYFKHDIDGSVQEIWVPMYLNYDEAELHNEKLTKKDWLGFLNWFWGNGKDGIKEPMGWIYQTESEHPTYFDNIELFHEMFKQYKEDGSFYNKEIKK